MPAATSDRNTRSRHGNLRSFPLAAATLIYAGVMAAVNAAGQLVNGATSPALKCVGVTDKLLDNSTGVAAAVRGDVRTGVWGPFANSAAADLIAPADVGADCFMVDNQTVAKTSAGATRSVAGKIFDVSADGVWVSFS
jgi:hypothetical protein